MTCACVFFQRCFGVLLFCTTRRSPFAPTSQLRDRRRSASELPGKTHSAECCLQWSGETFQQLRCGLRLHLISLAEASSPSGHRTRARRCSAGHIQGTRACGCANPPDSYTLFSRSREGGKEIGEGAHRRQVGKRADPSAGPHIGMPPPWILAICEYLVSKIVQLMNPR